MSDPQRTRTIYRVTIVGSIVNLLLVIFKFAAGILGRSSAMVADAVHSLSDLFSDIIVLWFVRLSSRPGDVDHDYGHGKYETLASLIVGLTLLAAGAGILIDGVARCIDFFHGVPLDRPGWIALVAALISIVSKEGLFRYTRSAARRVDSPALIANAWHHRSDALTSVAAVAGIGGAILLGPKWRVLDPLAAAVVSIFIIVAALKIIKSNTDQLLEKALPAEIKQDITQIILQTPGVSGIHRLYTRRLGPTTAIEAHVRMDGDMPLRRAHTIASHIEQRLRSAYGPATHVLIHMEPA